MKAENECSDSSPQTIIYYISLLDSNIKAVFYRFRPASHASFSPSSFPLILVIIVRIKLKIYPRTKRYEVHFQYQAVGIYSTVSGTIDGIQPRVISSCNRENFIVSLYLAPSIFPHIMLLPWSQDYGADSSEIATKSQ